MNRLFIVDPSLKDLRGHHYNLTRAVTTSAQNLGFAVTWLCSNEFDNARNIDGVTIDPVFRSSMYQQYMMPNKTGGKRGSFFKRLWHKKADDQPASLDQEQQFIADLRQSLANHKTNSQDRVLIHTADGVIFRALSQLLLGSDRETLPRFHVATPYNPTGIMPNKGDVLKIDASISALREASLIGSQLFLYGENQPLAEHLASHWGAPVRPLDLPVCAPTAEAINQGQIYRRDSLKVNDDTFLAISLGSARLEKGFEKLPAIISEINALLNDLPEGRPAPPKIKFVLHASPQIIGRHPKISEAIDTLSAMPRDLVELILDPLSEDEYEKLLFASDAVIMPYSVKDYAIRGSMIVTEAIVAGKLIIATKGTFPGYAASTMQGQTATSPAEFAKAILNLAENRTELTQQLDQAKMAFIEHNNVAKYWQKCLDAEKTGV